MAKVPRPGVTWPKGEICQSFGGTWLTEDPFFSKNVYEILPQFRMESDASMIIISIYLNLQTPRSLEVLGHFSFLQKEIFFSKIIFKML